MAVYNRMHCFFKKYDILYQHYLYTYNVNMGLGV